MVELAVAGGLILSMTIVCYLPTRHYPFYRMFFDFLNDVRTFLFLLLKSLFTEIRKKLKRSKKRSKSVPSKARYETAFKEDWVNPDGSFVHFVPHRTPVNFDQKTEQNNGSEDNSFDSILSTEGTEAPKIYTQDDLDGAVNHSRHKDLLNYIQKKRELVEAHNAAIDGLNQEHEEDIQAVKQKYEAIVAQVEQQWKSELKMTEHDLRMRLSEQQAEIDRLTRPDPRSDEKEQLCQLQQMRGAGLSRSQIVQRLFSGKLEGNSRVKYQREYDDLIFRHGVDWLRELRSYGLSSQKIVKAVWGDFKDGSAADYITRVEKAIESAAAPNDAPNNVIPLRKLG